MQVLSFSVIKRFLDMVIFGDSSSLNGQPPKITIINDLQQEYTDQNWLVKGFGPVLVVLKWVFSQDSWRSLWVLTYDSYILTQMFIYNCNFKSVDELSSKMVWSI